MYKEGIDSLIPTDKEGKTSIPTNKEGKCAQPDEEVIAQRGGLRALAQQGGRD